MLTHYPFGLSPSSCHGLLDGSCVPDHTTHLHVLLLPFAFASACSPWNVLPLRCLANSYSSVNTLLKCHLLLEVFFFFF